MKDLAIIEHQSGRVLTTEQLSEVYDTDSRRISENFNRNSDRFVDGKDLFKIEGDELKAFKSQYAGSVSPFATQIYLWTERGANKHAKILDTDKAWEQFDVLLDTYFRVKSGELPLPSMTPIQLIAEIAKAAAESEQRMNQLEAKTQQVERRLELVKDTVTIRNEDDWRQKTTEAINKIVKASGRGHQEVRNESYSLLDDRAHCDLDARLRNKKASMAKNGATKTAIEAANRLDVIDAEPRLKEIYIWIVKEMTIRYVA